MLPLHHGRQARRGGRGFLQRLPRPARLLVAALVAIWCVTFLRHGVSRLATMAATRHRAAVTGGSTGTPGLEVPSPHDAHAVDTSQQQDPATPSDSRLLPEEERACGELASEWAEAAEAAAVRQAAGPRLNLTYFLHVPRTAGRTTFWCALRPSVPPSARCSRSYDHLRVDPHQQPQCSLLSTHDDFSLVESFPGEVTVVTQLRKPLERVLSAYEFAVEVAGRTAWGTEGRGGQRGNAIDTRDVWPWSTLVNLMIEDMQERRRAAKGAPPQRSAPPGSGYDEPAAYMPLSEFVAHPRVADVLHNGAAFQLMGLTNNTRDAAHAATAARLRLCARSGGEAGDTLAAVALSRLRHRIAVVTLTERLGDSAAMLAASLGHPLTSPSYRTASDWDPKTRREQQALGREAFDRAAMDDATPLGVAYHACAGKQLGVFSSRKKNDRARIQFADGQGVNFDRRLLPGEVLKGIEEANQLDGLLYSLGVELFDQRRAAFLDQGRWESVEDVVATHPGSH
jgi:hypothetical protein